MTVTNTDRETVSMSADPNAGGAYAGSAARACSTSDASDASQTSDTANTPDSSHASNTANTSNSPDTSNAPDASQASDTTGHGKRNTARHEGAHEQTFRNDGHLNVRRDLPRSREHPNWLNVPHSERAINCLLNCGSPQNPVTCLPAYFLDSHSQMKVCIQVRAGCHKPAMLSALSDETGKPRDRQMDEATTELDQMQAAYKAAVEEWISAIRQEEDLASVNHEIADVDNWE
jgi:hypothetical protein